MVFSRGSQTAHISQEEDWNFAAKNCQKLGYLCITKIRLGEISLTKKVQVCYFVKISNPTMVQLNQI